REQLSRTRATLFPSLAASQESTKESDGPAPIRAVLRSRFEWPQEPLQGIEESRRARVEGDLSDAAGTSSENSLRDSNNESRPGAKPSTPVWDTPVTVLIQRPAMLPKESRLRASRLPDFEASSTKLPPAAEPSKASAQSTMAVYPTLSEVKV